VVALKSQSNLGLAVLGGSRAIARSCLVTLVIVHVGTAPAIAYTPRAKTVFTTITAVRTTTETPQVRRLPHAVIDPKRGRATSWLRIRRQYLTSVAYQVLGQLPEPYSIDFGHDCTFPTRIGWPQLVITVDAGANYFYSCTSARGWISGGFVRAVTISSVPTLHNQRSIHVFNDAQAFRWPRRQSFLSKPVDPDYGLTCDWAELE
jgi:hypothetical protein